ncbi:MAG: hypothetical protein K6A81_05090 [Clostridiales bacterium]|nr:hypothetical protein [Clostridiales bacterium]
MIEFFAFIFAGAFGFGLAFWIAATVLNNSNNYGDYHAEASYYSARVHFTSEKEGKDCYIPLGKSQKTSLSPAPKGRELVQKPSASRVHQSGQSEVPLTTPVPNAQIPASAPASAPKRRDPSAFPRSFHDV